MPVSYSPSFRNHEQVVFCYDADVGLNAIIAIHDTTLGPALGGVRMWPFASEMKALEDALRLSRGMTYKSALAGLPFGGGKAVIIGDPKTGKSEALLERFGEFVDSLGGRYITAEDVGTSTHDLAVIRRRTKYAAGFAEGGSGDPSPVTAWGVFHGIRAAVAHRLGLPNLNNLTVAVQGLGHVGMELVKFLHQAGATLVVTDIDDERVERAVAEFGARAVAPQRIYDEPAEVFAPCALGAVLNDETVPRLTASVVAGSANNQLAEDRHGTALMQRRILYAPDYVINAGGLIDVARFKVHMNIDEARAKLRRIDDTLTEIFERADRENKSTSEVADTIAEERFGR